jgi:tartrate-resistant acid phosphatase type 5
MRTERAMYALAALILTAVLLRAAASIDSAGVDQCAAPLDSPTRQFANDASLRSPAASSSPPPSAISPPPAFGFLTVGDWGCECGCAPRQTTAHHGCNIALQERAVAEKTAALLHRLANRTLLAANSSLPAIEFVISVGDHFYDVGARSVTDPRFQCGWADLFYAGPSTSAAGRTRQNASTMPPPPWYLVLGNHDYSGDIQAQIDYSRVHAGWNMPARYFSRKWVLPVPPISASNETGNTTLRILFLDTMHLCGDRHAQQRGEAADTQWNWLGAALAASRADFLLVVGHHPVFSGGPVHGNNRCLQRRLRPLLEAHGAHYLSGHEHTLQHLESGGVSYFVSGTACRVRPVCQMRGMPAMHFTLFHDQENREDIFSS